MGYDRSNLPLIRPGYLASHEILIVACDAAGEKLRPVMHELAYNLESFNPAFTAVLLKVRIWHWNLP